MDIIKDTKAKMQASIEHLDKELKTLRSGRAHPGMLEDVMVECYGSMMQLKKLGNISVAEARQLMITPFDPSTAGMIAKGIEKANLNLRPIVDGHVVRIPIPPMDESVRKEMVKQGKKKAEEAKVAIREIRRKQNEVVRKQKADGDIAEDQVKKLEKSIQEYTDQYCKEVDDLMQTKEKEIMTV